MKVMTVGDLIAQLNVLDKDTPVFGYHSAVEEDFPVRRVSVVDRGNIPYCQEISYMQEYFMEDPDAKPAVVCIAMR